MAYKPILIGTNAMKLMDSNASIAYKSILIGTNELKLMGLQ